MSAYLAAVTYALPDTVRSNADLVALNPEWDAEAIFHKTGIRERRIVAADETAADLAAAAAERLLAEASVERSSIDVLLLCTQSPDYVLPTTACLLQERLGLPRSCGALDFNLGCSGFTYGLWLAKALLDSGAAHNVLLVVADTYSRYCDPHDLATVTIFGDGAGAALLTRSAEGALAEVGPSVVGTDGRGAANLIVAGGGAKQPFCANLADRHLHMNGPEIFSFTLVAVKKAIGQLLEVTGSTWDEVDWYLFHQANGFMLKRLQTALRIAPERFPIDLEDIGNTVSATLPILLRRCLDRGQLHSGQRCVLAGFGVGYSWAMTSLRWLAGSPGGGR